MSASESYIETIDSLILTETQKVIKNRRIFLVGLRLGRILTRECKAIQLLADIFSHSIFRYVYMPYLFLQLNKKASDLYLGGAQLQPQL